MIKNNQWYIKLYLYVGFKLSTSCWVIITQFLVTVLSVLLYIDKFWLVLKYLFGKIEKDEHFKLSENSSLRLFLAILSQRGVQVWMSLSPWSLLEVIRVKMKRILSVNCERHQYLRLIDDDRGSFGNNVESLFCQITTPCCLLRRVVLETIAWRSKFQYEGALTKRLQNSPWESQWLWPCVR